MCATVGHTMGRPCSNVQQSIGWFDFTFLFLSCSFIYFFFFINSTISPTKPIYLRLRPLKFKASYFIVNPFAIVCRLCASGLFLLHFKSYLRFSYKFVIYFLGTANIPGTPWVLPVLLWLRPGKQILLELHARYTWNKSTESEFYGIIWKEIFAGLQK